MYRVIRRQRYERWCQKHGLNLAAALFEIETAYINLKIRSRPGALILFERDLVHFSYSWTDTLWAIFEPSIKVTIPIGEIAAFKRETLSTSWNAAFMDPESAFSIRTTGGDTHTLILQRDGNSFERALSTLLAN